MMGGSTKRNAIRNMYEACKTCPNNIGTYGVCKNGFENFYKRRTKVNHCPKVKFGGTSRKFGGYK